MDFEKSDHRNDDSPYLYLCLCLCLGPMKVFLHRYFDADCCACHHSRLCSMAETSDYGSCSTIRRRMKTCLSEPSVSRADFPTTTPESFGHHDPPGSKSWHGHAISTENGSASRLDFGRLPAISAGTTTTTTCDQRRRHCVPNCAWTAFPVYSTWCRFCLVYYCS